MAVPQYTEQTIIDILTRFSGDADEFTRHRSEYLGLVTQTKGPAKIQQDYLRLVFERRDGRTFSNDELSLLLGDGWQARHEKFKGRGNQGTIVLGREGVIFDLADVTARHAIGTKFNILGHDRGVRVIDDVDKGDMEIAPFVNLAIALTILACLSGRGAVFWQAKGWGRSPRQQKWSMLPSLFFMDFIWHEDEKAAFLNGSYRRQRDFLCANLRLRSHDVILPFALDFTGKASENDEEAFVQTDANGRAFWKAAISIPGAAFIGWCFEASASTGSSLLTASHCPPRVMEAPRQWWLDNELSQTARVSDLAELLQRMKAMFQTPLKGALIFYQHILDYIELIEMSLTQDQQQDEDEAVERDGDEDGVEDEDNYGGMHEDEWDGEDAGYGIIGYKR